MNRQRKRAMIQEIRRINRRNDRRSGGNTAPHWLRQVKLERSKKGDSSSQNERGSDQDGEPG